MITLDQVSKRQDELFEKCKSLVKMKGADYNREQQQYGDTLFNMRVSKLLGITDTTTQGVLTRLSDKFMRLISLTKNPKIQAQVKDESVKDTIVDAINYLTYLSLFYDEERQDLQTESVEKKQEWPIRQYSSKGVEAKNDLSSFIEDQIKRWGTIKESKEGPVSS